MGCRVRCESGPVLAQGDTCIQVAGTGVTGDPLLITPIIDPDPLNGLACGPNGLFSACDCGAISGSGILIAPDIPAGSPAPGPPATIIPFGPIFSSSLANPSLTKAMHLIGGTVVGSGTTTAGAVELAIGVLTQFNGGGFSPGNIWAQALLGALTAPANGIYMSHGYTSIASTPTLVPGLLPPATTWTFDTQFFIRYTGVWNAGCSASGNIALFSALAVTEL